MRRSDLVSDDNLDDVDLTLLESRQFTHLKVHARDAVGDTLLHIAARRGDLVLCDLLLRAGADPLAANREDKTPADLAFSTGHLGVSAHLLLSAVHSPEYGTFEGGVANEIGSRVQSMDATSAGTAGEPLGAEDDLEIGIPDGFEPEPDPREFFKSNASSPAVGSFAAVVSNAGAGESDEEADWTVDLSAAPISGEGFGSGPVEKAEGSEFEYLQVRKRGRQSNRQAVVQTGTRLSIDPERCRSWAVETLAKRWCSLDDMDDLLASCEGNGDLELLRINLIRILETAGLDIADRGAAQDVGLWDVTSEVPSEELAEAIEAALTRATPLPGTQRFTMDKSDERQLLDPMVRARQELRLGILACEAAVVTILHVMDRIRDGVRDASSVSLRSIIPSRLDHAETAAVFSAAEDLKSWQANGRVLDGKQRRGALAALEALDLSLAFHKELVRSLERDPASVEHARRLSSHISRFEAATERLVREHLPFVRRFASRNVEDGEDPEDVFQVAFIGMQNATRRFDPDLGYRFLVYATYWMRQAITRWRADEGSAVRIPVHRHETLTKLAKAMDRLDVRADGIVSERKLARELDWSIDEVRQFCRIPRQAEYREYLDEWDDLGFETNAEDELDRKQANTILAAALAELPDREARVIRMRFGIWRDHEMTLEEIGQLDGVTRERIRQIQARGLKRLQHPARLSRLRTLLGM